MKRKLISCRPGRVSTFVNPFFLCTLTTILIWGAAVAVAFINKINELVTWVHKYVVITQKINERRLLTVDVTTVQSFHRIESPYLIAICITWIRMWSTCESETHASILFIYLWFHLTVLSSTHVLHTWIVIHVKIKKVLQCSHGVIAFALNALVWNTHKNS